MLFYFFWVKTLSPLWLCLRTKKTQTFRKIVTPPGPHFSFGPEENGPTWFTSLCYDDFICNLSLEDRVKVESDRNYRMVGRGRRSILSLFLLVLLSLSTPSITVAYRPGDIVPMSKMGLYHSVRTPSLCEMLCSIRVQF